MSRSPQLTASPAGRSSIPPVTIFGIVLLAVLVKLGFMAYLGGRVYQDVPRALNFAALLTRGDFSIQTSLINHKTFLGPITWFWLYRWAGVRGLLTFNLAAFLALCGVQYRLGRGRYDDSTCAVAMVLFAFYVGTHRNVAAGEPDDNIAALLFALGMLIYVDTRRVLVAGLFIGVGFLFKFWVAIFGVGFAAYLVWKRSWRDLAWALAGMGVPFLALNCIDRLASFRSVFLSLSLQHGYSSWNDLGFKFLSTGLLPIALVATAAWWKRRSDVNTLFWFVSIVYPVYTILNRDAFAASFVLMLTMLFASSLLTETLLDAVKILRREWRWNVLSSFLAGYILLTTVVTQLNLYRDTEPIVFVTTGAAAREMFPWNYSPDRY
jgi:hypothetical protein